MVEGVGVEPSVADLKYEHDMVLFQAGLNLFGLHATKSGFLTTRPIRTHSERTYYNFIENIKQVCEEISKWVSTNSAKWPSSNSAIVSDF